MSVKRDKTVDELLQARAAYERRDWAVAFDQLGAVDNLSGDDTLAHRRERAESPGNCPGRRTDQRRGADPPSVDPFPARHLPRQLTGRSAGGAGLSAGTGFPGFHAPSVFSSRGRRSASVTSPTTTSSAFPGRQWAAWNEARSFGRIAFTS